MSTAQENKLVKIIMESSVIIGIAAGVGFIGKKMVKEPLINDPSSSLMNYGKWVLVMSGSLYLKDYLESKKIIPT